MTDPSPSPTPPALEVVAVERSFGGVKALQGLDLRVDAGEFAALIGPNGSGKSTLVNVITRMINADAGVVRVAGADVTRERRHRIIRHGVARSFQHVRLIPELTLRENAELGSVFHDLGRSFGTLRTWFGRGTRRADSAAVQEALDVMEVPEALRDSVPSRAPFAAQRHTEIARALVSRPKLLLLDEPVAGMNPAEVKNFLRILRSINASGTAILLIEHNMEFVMEAAQRITAMNRGQRIAHGPAEEVRRDPAVIEAYLGARRAAATGTSTDRSTGVHEGGGK